MRIKTEMFVVPTLDWWPDWEEEMAGDPKPVYCAVTGKVLGYTEGGVKYQGDTLRLRFAGVDFVAIRPVSSALTQWALEAIMD